MMRFDECNGQVTVVHHPSNIANVNTSDLGGRLNTREHLTRCISRIEHDGSI
jgi:gluconolactonase